MFNPGPFQIFIHGITKVEQLVAAIALYGTEVVQDLADD